MKKKVFIALMAFTALSFNLSAERLRIAILDLRAGVGMTQSDVDGLADMLSVELFNSGYFTVVERTQLNAVLSANNIKQHINFTQEQREMIGRKLNVDAVLVGTVNFTEYDRKKASDGVSSVRVGEYNVDVRLVSTSSGEMVSAAGGHRINDNERALMTDVARDLARNLDNSLRNSNAKVNILGGYLYVFPTDLGSFSSKPTSVIDMTNRQNMYGYSDWRIPTKEECSLMNANAKTLNLDRDATYAYEGAWYTSSRELTVRLVRTKAIVQQDVSNNSERAFFNKTSHNFGSIPILNGVVSTKFCLKNASKEEVSITNVTKTNSNITIEYSKENVQPGSETCIIVKYNPNGRQGTSFNNKIIVTLNNGETVTLIVSGKVV